MANHCLEEKSVPQIYLQQPQSTASDDLERLSTMGNVGLLRSMSARTVDSLPGVDSSHNSSGSGSRYFLSPSPGGMNRSGESMTARSTSCPSMAYTSGQSMPGGYTLFNRSTHEEDDDDLNLEGEVISDLPVEPTRLFPDLLPQLGLGLDDPSQFNSRDCDNGNVANHLSYGMHHPHHSHQHSNRGYEQDLRDPALPVSYSTHQSQRTRDYGTNPEIFSHRDPPLFAQTHSHTHRAIGRSNGSHEDIPGYNYIRYHRQSTKDTDSSIDAHRGAGGNYHRQSTKDSGTSTTDAGYSSARRSARRRSGKHSSASGSSQRQSTSSQTSTTEYTMSAPGGEVKSDKVINIRDLPSSVAKEVIAEKAHMDSNFNVDVQEKCIRWLNTLHVSCHNS